MRARARVVLLIAAVCAAGCGATGSRSATSTVASAGAGPRAPVALSVSPATGGPSTVFELSFTMPVASASPHTTASSPSLDVAGPVGRDCVSAHAQPLGRPAARAPVRTRLGPAQLGGRWCPGDWTARVVELVRARCPAGEMCPQFIRLVAIAGPADFRVRP